MSDLTRMMRDAAAEPTEYPDVDRAWRRARLHRAAFVALSLIAVIAVTGGAVIAASSFGESDTRPALPDDIEPGGGGAIAFSRSGPLGGIYVIESVDGDPVRVTSTKGDDHPAWSPDGSRIAFVRYEEGNQNIYVMKADGTTTVKLTDDGASGNPTWSPDGTRIAFQRQMDRDADIYVMNADGTDVTQLTDDPLIEYTPAWSPDGTSIAFVAYSYVPSGPTPVRLYVVNADGGGRRQLPAEDVAQPGWSPDGTKIAFVDSQRGSLYVINADGTGLRQVVDLAGVTEGRGNLTMSPSWSPDGTRIAFATGSTATSTHIYLVNEDGSGLLQLTDDPVSDANPDWAPASPRDSSTIDTNDETGLAITTPADWTIRWSQPPESTALYGATYDFDRSTSFCSSTGPLTTLPPDGAFFWMYEFDLPDAPARPENFSFDEESFASYEGSGCVATYRMDFADGGRTFSVHVAFGSEATATLRDEVLHALDSLEVRSGSFEDPPPCEDDQRDYGYGKTIPGAWLEDLLLELGAPGGHSLIRAQVRDTGTALQIDIPAYEDGPTMYATMLTPGGDSNVTASETEKQVGSSGSYTLYFDRGNPWQSYKASNGSWQISLLAYPGFGNDDVAWPDGTLDWLKEAALIAEQTPPPCEGPIT